MELTPVGGQKTMQRSSIGLELRTVWVVIYGERKKRKNGLVKTAGRVTTFGVSQRSKWLHPKRQGLESLEKKRVTVDS